MRVNNVKVNTAIEKLDKLSKFTYGYYLDTYNTRPDLSSKKYHLYVNVLNGYQNQNTKPVESFDTIKEFLQYVSTRINGGC
nr:MAG TPA: hypothetical protein [Herelleviridae sp.]